ncbi:MAG TPA: 30S ribosomal protein S20 [Blastocatellia bacterium]|nr:30S ribosomal protein S20 [Blastocatellia bacterium]
MPNHVSAEKRDRQTTKRNAVNTANRSKLRSAVKKLRAAIASKNASSAQELLPATISALDKAIQKGVIHRNTAARYKSRLTSHVNTLAAK